MSTVTTVVLAPNPSIFTGAGTNTYLVGDGADLLCIDPGPDDPLHLDAILAAAQARSGRVTAILLTHSHPDHRPLARRLAEATDAPVRCLDPARGDENAEALVDGDVVHAGGVTLRALHTPGHAQDHLCFHDEAENALYSGDHVLSGSTTVVAPPDGDMKDYMASLERLRALRPRVIHPGHGTRVDDGTALVETYIAHRVQRERQIEDAARRRGEPVRPADLVPELYAGYPEAVHSLAALTVRAHLDKLAGEHRAVRTEVDGELLYAVR